MTTTSDATIDPDAALAQAIVAHAPEAIIVADREGLVRVWNAGAERIFGHAASAATGQSLDLIIPEPLRQAHWRGFDAAIRNGDTRYHDRVMTTRSVHKDGRKLYVDLSFSLLRDRAGMILGALAVGRDVTERYLADRAERARVADLERRLEALPPAS